MCCRILLNNKSEVVFWLHSSSSWLVVFGLQLWHKYITNNALISFKFFQVVHLIIRCPPCLKIKTCTWIWMGTTTLQFHLSETLEVRWEFALPLNCIAIFSIDGSNGIVHCSKLGLYRIVAGFFGYKAIFHLIFNGTRIEQKFLGSFYVHFKKNLGAHNFITNRDSKRRSKCRCIESEVEYQVGKVSE